MHCFKRHKVKRGILQCHWADKYHAYYSAESQLISTEIVQNAARGCSSGTSGVHCTLSQLGNRLSSVYSNIKIAGKM